MTTDQDRAMARQCAHLFGGNGRSQNEQVELVANELAEWREQIIAETVAAYAPS